MGTPTFYDLEANAGGRNEATGDDPVVTLPGEPTAGADDATGTDASADDSSTDVAGGDAQDGTTVGGVQGPDGLTAGWFHDSAAWPQIALWGAVCALIAVIAHRISRRFQHYAIGWSIAIVPFVIALYFLYQNVNRLLPPGL